MFCGSCGNQIQDNCKWCPYCGAEIKNEEIAVNHTMPVVNTVAGNDSKYEKIFIEPTENYIASLGNGYLNSFFTGRKIKRCVALLSDKRIYLRGNMIDINSGKLEHYNMQKTLDLEDITGTGFIYASPSVWKLVLGIFVIPAVAGVLSFAVLWGLASVVVGILPIPAFILLFVSYIKSRNTLFFIEYAGGCIKFNASIYGLAESQDFEKQIRRAKNKVKETNTDAVQ